MCGNCCRIVYSLASQVLFSWHPARMPAAAAPAISIRGPPSRCRCRSEAREKLPPLALSSAATPSCLPPFIFARRTLKGNRTLERSDVPLKPAPGRSQLCASLLVEERKTRCPPSKHLRRRDVFCCRTAPSLISSVMSGAAGAPLGCKAASGGVTCAAPEKGAATRRHKVAPHLVARKKEKEKGASVEGAHEMVNAIVRSKCQFSLLPRGVPGHRAERQDVLLTTNVRSARKSPCYPPRTKRQQAVCRH